MPDVLDPSWRYPQSSQKLPTVGTAPTDLLRVPVSLHTGSSAFLRPLLALSNAICRYGPITGIFPAKLPIVAKKSPKRTNMPYISIGKPISGHRSSIRIIPAVNAAVPFHFCRREKKIAVFCSPMIRVRPTMKRTYSNA